MAEGTILAGIRQRGIGLERLRWIEPVAVLLVLVVLVLVLVIAMAMAMMPHRVPYSRSPASPNPGSM